MGDRRENEVLVRRALDAVNHRDVSALQDCLSPDVVWNETGSQNPLGGPFEGIGSVMTYLARLFDETADTLKIQVHDVTASDEHAVALVRLTATRGGTDLQDESLFVVHTSEGRIASVWSYSEDQPAVDRFWA
jgi:uncharacterized protein